MKFKCALILAAILLSSVPFDAESQIKTKGAYGKKKLRVMNVLTGSWKFSVITAVSGKGDVVMPQTYYFDTLHLDAGQRYHFKWSSRDTLENGSWDIQAKGKVLALYSRETKPVDLHGLPDRKFSIKVRTRDEFVIVEKSKIEVRYSGRPNEMAKIVYRTTLRRIH